MPFSIQPIVSIFADLLITMVPRALHVGLSPFT
jgi:hypothetical protein